MYDTTKQTQYNNTNLHNIYEHTQNKEIERRKAIKRVVIIKTIMSNYTRQRGLMTFSGLNSGKAKNRYSCDFVLLQVSFILFWSCLLATAHTLQSI